MRHRSTAASSIAMDVEREGRREGERTERWFGGGRRNGGWSVLYYCGDGGNGRIFVSCGGKVILRFAKAVCQTPNRFLFITGGRPLSLKGYF